MKLFLTTAILATIVLSQQIAGKEPCQNACNRNQGEHCHEEWIEGILKSTCWADPCHHNGPCAHGKERCEHDWSASHGSKTWAPPTAKCVKSLCFNNGPCNQGEQCHEEWIEATRTHEARCWTDPCHHNGPCAHGKERCEHDWSASHGSKTWAPPTAKCVKSLCFNNGPCNQGEVCRDHWFLNTEGFKEVKAECLTDNVSKSICDSCDAPGPDGSFQVGPQCVEHAKKLCGLVNFEYCHFCRGSTESNPTPECLQSFAQFLSSNQCKQQQQQPPSSLPICDTDVLKKLIGHIPACHITVLQLEPDHSNAWCSCFTAIIPDAMKQIGDCVYSTSDKSSILSHWNLAQTKCANQPTNRRRRLLERFARH